MSERECLDEIARVAACGAAASAQDLAWLLDCLGLPAKRLQRRAAEALLALDARGVLIRPSLEARLRGESFPARWGAAWALAQAGDPPQDVVPVLFEAMASDDGDLRWAAARIAVERFAGPALAARLLAAAADERCELRKMALYCLRDLGVRGPECEGRLRAALRDESAGVRLAGMSGLARLGSDPEMVATALLGLLDDPQPGVRRAAAATLGRLGCRAPAVATALARAAGDDDASLARAAARALATLGIAER